MCYILNMETEKIPRWLLILGIAGPLLLVGGVLVLVNLNNWLVSFDYDLVYVTCEGSGPAPTLRVDCEQYIQQRYAIEQGALVVRDDEVVLERIFGAQRELDWEVVDPIVFSGWTTRLYVHDIEADRSREISPEELSGRSLTAAQIAPDGTELRFDRQYYGSPFFIFGGGGSRSSTILVQGSGQRKINLPVSSNRWDQAREFRHLGWVARVE